VDAAVALRESRLESLRAVLPHLLPLTLAAAACGGYGWLSIRRHDLFGTGGYDLGIFDQTIWGYSHLAIVTNTVKRVPLPNLLGDHFHPLLAALAPTYWMWNNVRVLLLDQSLLLALASLPVFWFARERLGRAAALAFQLAFLASWGVLDAVGFDFHEYALAAPLVALGLYAAVQRRTKLLCSVLPVALLVREDVALAFVGIALYLVVAQRRYLFGALLAAVSLGWLMLVTQVVIPAIADGPYAYWTYGALGGTLASVALTVIARPWIAARLSVDNSEKLTTISALLGGWAFLPLLSPFLLAALPLFAERFWSSNDVLWGTKGQYSIMAMPILAFAAVDGAARIKKRAGGIGAALPAVVLAAACGVSVLGVHPLRGINGVVTAARARAIEECLELVPPSVSVAASDRLIPHLSHRLVIRELSARLTESYLAVDVKTHRDGRFLAGAAADHYWTLCRDGGVVVLARTV